MGSFSVVSSTSRVAPLARASRARASRFSGGLAPFAGSRSASRRRVVVRAAPGPEPDDVQRTAREVREAAREAAREVDELLRRYDELRDDVHLTPDARSNVVVAGSSSSVTSSSTTRALRGTDPDNEGNVADENQPAYRERWGGSDDEDDAVAAAGGAPSRVRPPDPDPDPDAFDARYTDEDIARVQIDGLTHAAVFDEAASRIDRETAAADLRRRDPSSPRFATSACPAPARPTSPSLPTRRVRRASVDTRTIATSSSAPARSASEGVDPAEASSLHMRNARRDARRTPSRDGSRLVSGRQSRLLAHGIVAGVRLDEFEDWRRGLVASTPRDGGRFGVGRNHARVVASAFAVGEPRGYLPGKLFDLDRSAYGDESELIALCEALTDVGIVPVCDVVINHRTADDVGPEGVYNVYDDLDPDGEPVSWGSWAITCDDPTFRGRGGPDSGENYGPAPDLDHANPELRATLARWMAFLRDEIGFGGFRFDFVRGYAPEYVEEYVRATFGGGHVSKPPTVFNVGENWVDMRWEGSTLSYDQDGPRRTLVDWIGATHGVCADAFDFPTKGILQRAVQHTEYWRLADPANRPPGLLGWVPERAVTFTDNHDTGYPQNHWPFPEDRQALGYAYVLTHPGVPCVYGPHLWDAANHPEWDSGARTWGR